MTKEDVSLMALLADIDEVLTAHHADTAQVVAAGQQLILSAFGQIVDECPTADHAQLAHGIADQLRSRLRGRLLQGQAEMAEA